MNHGNHATTPRWKKEFNNIARTGLDYEQLSFKFEMNKAGNDVLTKTNLPTTPFQLDISKPD